MRTLSEPAALPISAVERETGLPKDTLRIWERRYGFPQPVRDSNGDRLYSTTQIERLRVVKRLVDQGMRPGKLLALPDHKLRELTETHRQPVLDEERQRQLERHLQLIKRHQGPDLKKMLGHQVMREGLRRFVTDTIAPLNLLIGEAWMRGEIEVFEEHLYTELAQTTLRNAITTLQFSGRPPKVLLTTFPNELHALGLLMVEAILASEAVDVVPLGTQLPLSSIAAAATAHRADVVGLSFSSSFHPALIVKGLQDLCPMLSGETAIWAGGSGMRSVRRPLQGVTVFSNLDELETAISAWREQREAA